jgi:hypothetical protein
MWKAFGGYRRSLPFDCRNSLLQIDGIPEDDRGNNQIEPTGLVLQILPQPITNRTAPVKEHRPSQRIVRLAFVQTEVNPAPEFRALNPVEREQCSLDSAKFA